MRENRFIERKCEWMEQTKIIYLVSFCKWNFLFPTDKHEMLTTYLLNVSHGVASVLPCSVQILFTERCFPKPAHTLWLCASHFTCICASHAPVCVCMHVHTKRGLVILQFKQWFITARNNGLFSHKLLLYLHTDTEYNYYNEIIVLIIIIFKSTFTYVIRVRLNVNQQVYDG